jgi:RND family efflux transporter MFP subunit
MKNKLFLITASITLALLLAACSKKEGGQQQYPTTRVSTYTVKPGQISYYDEYPGTVTALNQVEIRPEVSGYITNIYFTDGQYVKKGDKLYSIEEQQYKAAYDVAKANLEKAQQDYDRYNELAKNDAIAAQTLEHAEADLKAAQSSLAAQETNLHNSTIYAPFNGTIGISQVKLGSAVTAGQTLMNAISSDNPIAVDFQVDEEEISNFTRLLHEKINKEDSTFTIVLPDQSIYPYPGHLILMDRAVDPETGTITARLELPNENDMLRPGLTCNVRVLHKADNKIVIPFEAVTVQMGEYFVFVVEGNKVSQQRIEIGRNFNGKVIVQQGLKPGEEIVTQGLQRLRDGSPVIVADSTVGTAQAAANPNKNTQTNNSSNASGRKKK